MHAHKEGIESTLSETKIYLDKLHQEISKTLEKISSREKYINNQACFELAVYLCEAGSYYELFSAVGRTYSRV